MQDAPPPLQLERWGRVDVTLQELRPFLRATQPGVGAGQVCLPTLEGQLCIPTLEGWSCML